MVERAGEPSGTKRAVIFAGLVAAAVLLFLLLRPSAPPAPEGQPLPLHPEPTQARETPAPSEPAPEPTPVAVRENAVQLEPGRTLPIDASTLPSVSDLTVDLPLPAEAARSPELAVRVIDPSGGVFEATAQTGGVGARFALPAAQLARRGRYIVEIETTDESHFPLRRYAIELR